MSTRSRREHKPTSKFLNYYSNEIDPSATDSQQDKKQSYTKKNTPAYKKNAPASHRAISISNTNSSSIRRSNRPFKPNRKLKEVKKPVIVVPVKTDTRGSLKSVATVSPMIRKDGITTPFKCSKHITVELVDCLEGSNKGPSPSLPVAKLNEVDDAASVNLKRRRSSVSRHDTAKKKLTFNNDSAGLRKRVQHSSDGHPAGSRVSLRKGSNEQGGNDNVSPKKIVTNVKKVTRAVVLDSTKRKLVTRNNRTNVLKNYPTRSPEKLFSKLAKANYSSSPQQSKPNQTSRKKLPSEGIRSSQQRSKPNQTSRKKPSEGIRSSQQRSKPNQTSRKKLPSEGIRSSTQQSKPNQTSRKKLPSVDIRGTLKKFLIMGTKVANAISKSLKHNEEALLCKSSAFEKKCLSLVHALAKQGTDLDEDDMGKVLSLLDEEQEERKVYRRTFLESLKVSHLTNMALYGQMLRLLKTL